MNFFDRMAESLRVPIHILLGNHDMNLKHSSKVSSLDALATNSMHKGGSFHLYREITPTSVAGIPALMIPYHEDASSISDALRNIEAHADLRDYVVFGHLAVNGAIQNSSSSFRYHGALPAQVFRNVRRTFSGHFHVHQTLPNNVTYVGAPLQFNFGDAGADRGAVIYDAGRDTFRFIVNPLCHQYFKLTEEEAKEILTQRPETFKDSYVTVLYSGAKMSPSHHEELRQRFIEAGAHGVFKQSDVMTALRETGEQLASKLQKQSSVEDQVRLFADSVRKAFLDRIGSQKSVKRKKSTKTSSGSKWDHFLVDDTAFRSLVEFGVRLVRDSNLSTSNPVGSSFDGRLARLSMTNFMGIRGTVEIPLSNLPRGIWLIDGDNGAGKSTIFEAIVWCQFGEFLRSGMQKDFAINDFEDYCTVSLEYENGFIIERSRRRGRTESLRTLQRTAPSAVPQYLEQNELGELRNTQKLVNDKLGIDFETFSKSVVLGQNIFANFVSGSREQRRSIIEDMLGLDKFNALFDNAKSKRQLLEKQLEDLARERQTLQQKISDASDTLSQLSSQIRSALSLKASEARAQHDAELRKEASVGHIRKLRDNVAAEYRLASQSLDEFKATNRDFSVANAYSTIAELSLKEKHVKSILSNQNECPTCGQLVDPHHISQLLADSISLIQTAVDQFSLPFATRNVDLPSCLCMLGECKSKIEDLISSSQRMMDRLSSAQRTLELRLVQLENDILRCESQHSKDIQELRERIAAADSVLETQQSMSAKIETALRTAQPDLERLSGKIFQVEEEYNFAKFWELAFDRQTKTSSGFSTIRSFIFEELVVELNAIIDTYADQLANKTPLKVTLTSELDIEEIYGKRSGGERKRTDLAVLFSLFEIVRDRSRYRPNFIMLDEVFDALDRSGRVTVGQVLMELSRRIDNVFVITHTDLATGLSLAGTITARMTLEDSRPAGTVLEIHSF
eukprot:TRINITY_DN433_c0_g2_i1.p1 TRINITY_DN433_c0_g2~~TRINITY_DN433_c0_g2_i1.p1  ORF type:complete len:963 (+),score=120.21 TRINITY_DN433_c0_g2_i1:558-3446(+)